VLIIRHQYVDNSSTAIGTTVEEECQYDAILLPETWHILHDDVALQPCIPAGFACLDVPRPSTKFMKQQFTSGIDGSSCAECPTY
jgi:hypothetical protein